MATEKRQSRNSLRNSVRTNSEQCAVVKRANCGGKWSNKKRKNMQRQFMNENDYRRRSQEVLYTPEYIFSKIFRKDGPQLGDEFDSLPEHAFENDTRNTLQACQENQRALKRRKVLAPSSLDGQAFSEVHAPSPAMKHGFGKGLVTSKGDSINKYGKGKGWMTEKSASVKRHGIGKGLMTVWLATNAHTGGFPIGVDIVERAKEKKKKSQQRQSIMRKVANKMQDRRKTAQKSRKVENRKAVIQKQPRREKCELALREGRCQEDSDRFALLLDDEELELQELQAGPNPLSCCTHFTSNGLRGCSLCKGLLANFPPDSVTMKLPLYMQPWGSSPEFLKKLFKAYHFLCTYATIIDISSFTLDEFAHAFHVKDSLLLGQVHVVLLKLLLSDVETQLSSRSISHASKSCNFLCLLQSVEHQQFILKMWLDSLNALTWTEILQQVLAAAGFGSKCDTTHREAPSKEFTLMAKYGLSPGTLKGELFSVLLMHGNNGMKVPDLAKVQTIVELNLVATANELEDIISSTLSTDITLFEKISYCGYRLRINTATLETDSYLLDAEEDSEVSSGDSSSDGSDSESLELVPSKSRKQNQRENKSMLTAFNEIDESHPGEPWLLGLKEGEYSNLSIEEKLNALCALVDLLTVTSSFRMQDKLTSVAEYAPVTKHYGSGAKIKRSTARQCNSPGQLGCFSRLHNDKDMSVTSICPVDSSVPMSKNFDKNNFSSMYKDAQEMDDEDDLHHMQSIFLGSDRRYNRYWILLGPCDDFDPGHRRIYFESSEDGHWEVIDTEEALCSLLSALDHRGAREACLLASLEKWGTSLCRAMSTVLNDSGVSQLPQSCHSEMSVSREDSTSSAVSDLDNLCFTEVKNGRLPSAANSAILAGKNLEPQRDKWSLPQAFDTWIWKSFYSNLSAVRHGKRSYLNSLIRCECCHDLYWRDERHCRICHTTFELDFNLEERYAIHSATCGLNADTDKSPEHKVLYSKLQSLKAAIYAVESIMPEDALVGSWTKFAHNLWAKRLRRASTLTDVLQVLADFVVAINEDWLYQLNHDESNYVLEEILANFPTMPQTFSAVALWLVKLDALVAHHLKSAAS